MEHIIRIFQHLKDERNIRVTIKDFTRIMFHNRDLAKLKSFEAHSNRFCMYIKSNTHACSHCVETSNIELYNKIYRAQNPERPFWGTCYCGVKEYVIPIISNHIILGALLVGQFPCEEERRRASFQRLSMKYDFIPSRLESLYAESFPEHPLPDEITLSTLYICANYIASYLADHFDLNKPGKRGSDQTLLNTIITYIHSNIKNKIQISDIAEHCHCSESTVSHCFRENMNVSIGKYIVNRRISKAKDLLAKRQMSIAEIAEKCGFFSTEYFSNAFKSNVGISPIRYREQFQTKSKENK